MSTQLAQPTTLDRPVLIIDHRDERCETVGSDGKLLKVLKRRHVHAIPDIKLDHGGQVVMVYDEENLFVFELPWASELDPRFEVGQAVEVVGTDGWVRWRSEILCVGTDHLVTADGQAWSRDGSSISELDDLQIRPGY